MSQDNSWNFPWPINRGLDLFRTGWYSISVCFIFDLMDKSDCLNEGTQVNEDAMEVPSRSGIKPWEGCKLNFMLMLGKLRSFIRSPRLTKDSSNILRYLMEPRVHDGADPGNASFRW